MHTVHIQQRHRLNLLLIITAELQLQFNNRPSIGNSNPNRGKTGYFQPSSQTRLIEMRAAGQKNKHVAEFCAQIRHHTLVAINYRNLDFGRLCVGPCAAWKILRSGIHSKIHQWRHQSSQYAKYVDGTRLHRLLFYSSSVRFTLVHFALVIELRVGQVRLSKKYSGIERLFRSMVSYNSF